MPFISVTPTFAHNIVGSLRLNTNLFLPIIILAFGVPGFIACSQRAFNKLRYPEPERRVQDNGDAVKTLADIPTLLWVVLSIMLFLLCAVMQWWVCVLAWRKAKDEWMEENRIRVERGGVRLEARVEVVGM